jgi:hypothetical protein
MRWLGLRVVELLESQLTGGMCGSMRQNKKQICIRTGIAMLPPDDSGGIYGMRIQVGFRHSRRLRLDLTRIV